MNEHTCPTAPKGTFIGQQDGCWCLGDRWLDFSTPIQFCPYCGIKLPVTLAEV
ncbi:MAG: hypothetical protein ABI980_13185 [Nitrospirota bacterium]